MAIQCECGGPLLMGQEIQRRLSVDPLTGKIGKKPIYEVVNMESLYCPSCSRDYRYSMDSRGRIKSLIAR